MRIFIGVVLMVHALAHLPGVLMSWKLADLKEMPYRTTLFMDRLDVGDTGRLIVGGFWLAVTLAFTVAGVAVFARQGWWPTLTICAAILSLALSVLGLPESRFGIGINLLILAILITAIRIGWLSDAGLR